ncbi:hypothetical protein A8C75_11685 [Marinobacterium aestuarii]|uniref:Uncharacterized protein n=1 Tax=Marinobacterium aestuarii TaxID=1821621 RepID=A0A1A9EZK7_9GAMM|nr:hypothetical protein A8C75_11685 [Marinobacterium aestuarii]
MAFWNRPVRYRTHGADYLGSLFAEGGLPWKLIQNDSHGFGRAVKAGLRRYHQCRSEGRDLVQVIREYSGYFPQSFQTDEKCQLLASIVETLMMLAEPHDLSGKDDPAGYLNLHYPQWRAEFPLPLEEDNGYTLVNEWLRDAGVRLAERKRSEAMARYFTCEHLLDGRPERGRLLAEVTLAPSLQLKLDGRKLGSTRIELALYEGEQLVLKLGAAYGRLERDALEIKLPAQALQCRRRSPENPLLLTCWCAGEKLHSVTIQSSEVDWHQLPTTFVEDDDDIRLVGTASVRSEASSVLVRIPPHLQIQNPSVSLDTTDSEGGRWYRIEGHTVITDQGSSYIIEPGCSTGAERVELLGVLSPYDTLPVATWLGWPGFALRNSASDEKQPQALRIDNRLVSQLNGHAGIGSFRVDLLGEERQVVARRKVGVLPRDLSISAMSASSMTPARVLIKSSYVLDVAVLNDSLRADIRKEPGAVTVFLVPDECHRRPERVLLRISDPDTHADGVVIRLPYPEEGALLLGPDGKLFEEQHLNIGRILGMTLVMTPAPSARQPFHLSLELMGSGGALRRHYTYDAANASVQISLFSFYDDLQSLFSSSAEQDALVRVRVETSRQLKQFYIRRYDASIRFTNPPLRTFFELADQNGHSLDLGAKPATVLAMQVDSPETSPVELQPQVVMESICTGIFEMPERLQKDGPWLLYPAADSKRFFRPVIYVPDPASLVLDEDKEVTTLQSAARYFHPRLSPDPFDAVLEKMAGNFMHSSWLYLAELKKCYEHIPLSALEAWKHLARHPRAMALAVFRLEMDSHFATRLVQELAVIWERITVSQWMKAVDIYAESLSSQFGIPAEQIRQRAEHRMELLANQVPAFRYLAASIGSGKGAAQTSSMPLKAVIPVWLQQMRLQQEDAQWPVNLNESLIRWLKRQDDYAWMLSLPMPGFMLPVCIIPVLSAFITAGCTDLSELTDDDAELRFGIRVLTDFDRNGWYEPVYSAVLSELLKTSRNH